LTTPEDRSGGGGGLDPEAMGICQETGEDKPRQSNGEEEKEEEVEVGYETVGEVEAISGLMVRAWNS
jgi:hypothetical protein